MERARGLPDDRGAALLCFRGKPGPHMVTAESMSVCVSGESPGAAGQPETPTRGR